MKMLARAVPVAFAAAALVACTDRAPEAASPAEEAPVAGAAASTVGDTAVTATPNAPAPTPPAAPEAPARGDKVEADYLGRWTGVEGMYLVVTPKPGGGVALEMQWDLDNKGTFDGSVTAEGLRFMRNGAAESAVHTDGDATGLKHLAGKQDCLTVKPGEGYCRD